MSTLECIDLLTVNDVMLRCRVGRTFLYEEIKSGRLRCVKLGRLTRFRADEVARWLRDRNAETSSAGVAEFS